MWINYIFAHGGHPVLWWMMDNIFIRTDPAGDIKADKEKSKEMIVGTIAIWLWTELYAVATMMVHRFNDDREILFI